MVFDRLEHDFIAARFVATVMASKRDAVAELVGGAKYRPCWTQRRTQDGRHRKRTATCRVAWTWDPRIAAAGYKVVEWAQAELAKYASDASLPHMLGGVLRFLNHDDADRRLCGLYAAVNLTLEAQRALAIPATDMAQSGSERPDVGLNDDEASRQASFLEHLRSLWRASFGQDVALMDTGPLFDTLADHAAVGRCAEWLPGGGTQSIGP